MAAAAGRPDSSLEFLDRPYREFALTAAPPPREPTRAAHISSMAYNSNSEKQQRTTSGRFGGKHHSLPETSPFGGPADTEHPAVSARRRMPIPWEQLRGGRSQSPRARAIMALYSELGSEGVDIFAVFASIEEIEAAPVWPRHR